MSGVPWGDLKAPDEEYLKVAVTRLLPLYYSAQGDAAAGEILRTMADAFMKQHSDAWLLDVLKTPHSALAADAFAALGRATQANGAVDPIHGGRDARYAERRFRELASKAGALRADLEYVTSLQLRGLYDVCTVAAEPVLEAAERRPYPWLVAGALTESGVCRGRSGDFERAAMRCHDALAAAEKSGYPVLRLRALGFNADRLRRIGSTAKTWREDSHGLALYWDGNYPTSRAQQFYADLSFLAEDTGLVNASAAVSRENEEITRASGLTERHAGALQRRAMSEIAAGYPDRAEAPLREAARLASTLPVEQRLIYTLNTEMDMATLEASLGELKQPLDRLTRIEPLLAQHADALRKLMFKSEFGKLRLRQERYVEARKLLQEAFTIGERSRARTSEAERPLWMRTMANTARALVECELQTGDAESAWGLWARYREALFDPKTPSSIRAPIVLPGQAILSFVDLPSGLAAWLRTNESPPLFRWLDVPAKNIREAAGRLTRGCSNERSPEKVLRGGARELSQFLLGPWEHHLDGIRTVVIETDDPVSALPWPALVRSNGHYWTEDFAIEIRGGAGRVVNSDPHLASVQEALAVGEPATGDMSLPPLPEARQEAEKVSSLFPRSIFLEGQKATLPRVRAGLRTAQLFHFAGHGYGGEGGGLIMTGNEGGAAMLRAADIGNLDLSRCLLAVLSGCSTGSGELQGPGDPQSLVRAFLRAGAREVVASYWNLSSAGTTAFMQEFYRGISSGAPVAESLRQATKALRSGGTYRHPYYWAGLEVFQ